MEALPLATAFTIPFLSTVATLMSEEAYARFDDRVTSSVVPSEKVAETVSGPRCPDDRNRSLDGLAKILVGMSGRSTSIRIDFD